MKRLISVFIFCLAFSPITAQDITLPEDLRQHNLTQFNTNLLNPTFSLNGNYAHAIALWNRWQWQTIDGDPTSIFLNYTGKLSGESAIAAGFLQHNTGTFLNTGGVLNYSHSVISNSKFKLIFGVNLLGFQQELADDRFIGNGEPDIPELEETGEFLLRASPGVAIQISDFNIALVLENGINLISSENDGTDSGKNFIGQISNDFPISFFSSKGNAFVRPSIYVKTFENTEIDTQFGLNTLLSTPVFWLQGGYNSFYGPSAGVGVTVAKRVSLGGLFEFSTGSDLSEESSTFELLLSYHFGKTDTRKKVVGFEKEEPEEAIKVEEAPEEEEAKKRKETRKERLEREQREKDSLRNVEIERRNAAVRDSINRIAEQKRVQDSINKAIKAKEAALLAEKKRQDSIAALQNQEVEARPGEKYQEVTTADGLEPGFYLIANVFGTQRYYENFMKTLRDIGLEPKSFYRKLNNYNYVYLKRYNTIDEARQARDSKFDGKYPDKTWIFRVRRN